MGFFSSIFSGTSTNDPTVAWSFTPVLSTPEVSLVARRIGMLAFGASLDQAQIFGRPDVFRRTHHNYFELVYARAGFQLDFEDGLMVYAAFFVGPDEFEPKCRNLRYSQPREIGGACFSEKTTRENLEALFGSPTSVDQDSEETVVNFERNGLTLEFELSATGRLKRWNLYPKETSS